MSGRSVEQQYRVFLLVVTAGVLAGTLVELWFTEHMESFIQVIPFILIGIGLVAVLAAVFVPSRGTLLALRAVAVLLAAGGLYGIYEHFAHNLAFELEIRPNASPGDVWREALRGASPMLAPGALTLAAVLAAAATHRHDRLKSGVEAELGRRNGR